MTCWKFGGSVPDSGTIMNSLLPAASGGFGVCDSEVERSDEFFSSGIWMQKDIGISEVLESVTSKVLVKPLLEKSLINYYTLSLL